MKHYRLDAAGIMFAVNLTRDGFTSPTQRNNAIKESDINTKIFATWKVITQTVTALHMVSHIVALLISLPLDVHMFQAHKREFTDIAVVLR